MTTTTKSLGEVKREIESIMEFGDVPSYSVEAGHKYLYVCRNNGCFHRGQANGIPGWATFLGRFTAEVAMERFGLNT